MTADDLRDAILSASDKANLQALVDEHKGGGAMITRMEFWHSLGDGSWTGVREGCEPDLRAQGLLEPDATLAYTLEGTWVEIMTEHHRRQGWGPYRPPNVEG